MDTTIKIAREWRGLKQAELAGMVGVSQTYIADWESGRRKPKPDSVDALALALDVDAAWIAGYPAMIPVPCHMTGAVYQMPVIHTVPIDNYGTLYVVLGDTEEADNGPMSVIVGDGLTITQRRWDSACPPESAEEIEQYDANLGMEAGWYAPDGSPCVMVDGLPRAGWWA